MNDKIHAHALTGAQLLFPASDPSGVVICLKTVGGNEFHFALDLPSLRRILGHWICDVAGIEAMSGDKASTTDPHRSTLAN